MTFDGHVQIEVSSETPADQFRYVADGARKSTISLHNQRRPTDIYRAIRCAMWKLRRNMSGHLRKKKDWLKTATTLRNESVHKPQQTFYDIYAKTKWRRHGKMVRSREQAPPQEHPDPGCLVHAPVASGCDECQGLDQPSRTHGSLSKAMS